MTRYDLFGTSRTQDEIRVELEALLGVAFVPRESSFWGGDYYSYEAAGGTEVRIRNNRDIDPGELAEPDFPEHPVLLDVTMAEGAGPIGDLASKITGLTRLRQRVY